MPLEEIKKEIESLVKQNKLLQAHIKLGEFIKSDSTPDNYMYAEKIYKQIAKELNFPAFKIGILRSIAIEPMLPFIKVKSFENKINPELYLGDYNIIDHEMSNEKTVAYTFLSQMLV